MIPKLEAHIRDEATSEGPGVSATDYRLMLRSVLDEVDHLRQSEERSLRLLEEALVMLEEFVPGFTVVTSEIRDHLGLPD